MLLDSISARRLALAACMGFLALADQRAHAGQEEDLASNVYLAGAEVRIDRGVEQDVVAAAGRLYVEQAIVGDAVLAAGSVDVYAPVGDDLRVAAGIATLASRVHGEVLVAAFRIVIAPGADLRGPGWLAGSYVSIGGRSLAGLKVYARHVVVLGEVHGPLEISAGRIEIQRTAQIHGDVKYSSSEEIRVEPGARITGTVTRTSSALAVVDVAADTPLLKAFRPLLLCGLLIAGVLLYTLFPRFTTTSADTLARSPIKSLGLGTAIFFGVPPVALLLVLTIIGIPIGVALMAFHAVALLAAYLVIAHFIADRFARVFGRKSPKQVWRFVFLAISIVLLSLAGNIPYAGVAMLLLIFIAGLGAMALQAFNRYSVPRQQPADAWPSA